MTSTRDIATTGLTDEQLEEATRRFILDPTREMTYSRRLALWWYGENPSGGGPSLAKAWAFFDHVTLQRYIEDDNQTERERGLTRQKSNLFHMGDRKMRIAEPGEANYKTKLYPIFSTPLSQLGDFGLGFGIYFATLRDFAILAFLCGLISIPNIMYFASTEYSGDQEGVPTLLKGSAICTDRSWVPCPNCTQQEFDNAVKGAYDVKRFGQTWTAVPDPEGYYWNVTEYLQWELVNGTIPKTSQGTVNTDYILNNSIPIQDGVEFSPTDGFILDEVNVTERLGYTPLWCGYLTTTDCYLDLYPFFKGKDNQEQFTFVDQSFLEAIEYPADTKFVQLGFALRNNCDGARKEQGYVNWATLILMIIGSFFIRYRMRKMEVKFDEDEQTAQDYSICVKNPPGDAWDPKEWKQFFENVLREEAGGKIDPGHEIRVCTVDVDNEFAINRLVDRREALRRLEMALPRGAPLDIASLEQHAQHEKEESGGICGGSTKIQDLVKKVKQSETDLRSYFEKAKRPPTTKVYLTFETEAAQRKLLTKMTVGTIQAANNSVNLPEYCKFRGKHVLEVREAHEPSTIRWRDQDATRMQVGVRKFLTTIATISLMLIAYFVIRAIYKNDMPWLASIVTTIFTSLFPMIATWLMDLEKHHSESSRQAWLFLKVTMFNIFVTTVLLSLITPFEATLDKQENSLPGLLPAVYSLFFSQLGLTPALQLLDIGGNIQRHIVAPRAETQAEMNLAMRGTPVHLAVRYGNFIKFLYLTIWYCSIYPGTYFLGAFALLITYFVDRFSLMRSWARSPHVGAEISYFARRYFVPVGICMMSVMSAYYWSGFPYDNLCLVDAPLPSYYVGEFDLNLEAESFSLGAISLYNVDAVRAHFAIEPDAEVYEHCNQDLRSYAGLSFPALPQYQPEGEEWMTDEQEGITSLHGWSSLVVLAVITLQLLVQVGFTVRRFFVGNYKARGKDQGVPFSEVPTIASYIPQVSSEVLAYPLLLVDTKNIDPKLFSWHDPEKPHSHYDITHDIDLIMGRAGYEDAFARVMHWNKEESNAEIEKPKEEPFPRDATADVAPEDGSYEVDAGAENVSGPPENKDSRD